MPMLTLPFGDPICRDANVVGGKAAGLARLVSIGTDVPAGFVISAATRLEDQDRADLEEAVGFLTTNVCDAEHYCDLAVRSSASSEDGNVASFAGMYETFLNVDSRDVFERVKQCRLQTGSQRVIAYSQRLGLIAPDTPISVIVQRMVSADVSGVCFTMNPVNGNKNEFVIEALRGQGDRLVKGQSIPDYYRLESKSGRVLERMSGERSGHVLNWQQLRSLWKAVAHIDGSYDWPVDIEFAFSRTKLFVLQARPVTTTDTDGKVRNQ